MLVGDLNPIFTQIMVQGLLSTIHMLVSFTLVLLWTFLPHDIGAL